MGIVTEFFSDMAGIYGECMALPFTAPREGDWLGFTVGLAAWAVSGIAAGVIGLAGYSIHKSHEDANNLVRMDAAPTLVFKDIAQCQTAGKEATFCVDAFRTANGQHQRKNYNYSSMDKCVAIHSAEHCTAVPYNYTSMILVGKVMVPVNHKGTHYKPELGGFQVAADNPALAIPVYKTAQPGTMVRPDLKLVNLGM